VSRGWEPNALTLRSIYEIPTHPVHCSGGFLTNVLKTRNRSSCEFVLMRTDRPGYAYPAGHAYGASALS